MRRSTYPLPSLLGKQSSPSKKPPRARGRPVLGTMRPQAAVIGLPDQLLYPMQKRQEEVGVKIRILALHDARRCARGQRRCPPTDCGSGVRLAVRRAVELHEHQVPDLEEASRLGRRSRTPRSGSPRHRQPDATHSIRGRRRSRCRDRRAGVSHLPEVVLVPQAVDPVVGQTPATSRQSARASSSV